MLRLAADENLNNNSVQAIEGLILLVECSTEREWEGQVRYLPL